jgi:hypothetical protein
MWKHKKYEKQANLIPSKTCDYSKPNSDIEMAENPEKEYKSLVLQIINDFKYDLNK